MDNGVGYAERLRLDALERWRDQVDSERGTIMGDLGEVRGLLSGLRQDVAEVKTVLTSIQERLEDRPSRAEMQKIDRDVGSLRAKAENKIRGWTKLKVSGPAGLKFELLGVSGVTIVVVFFLIALLIALFFVMKK